jgi:ACS family hexuronate transporter-like MFS transporter
MTIGQMPSRIRWILFALVVTAGILNLVDRQIIAVLKPAISAELGWSDNDYGSLAAWFQGSAAVAFLFTGWIADRLGVKWANPLGVAAWSMAAIAHGWAHSMVQFILCRIALGTTEAMGTPTGIKTIATIFPPSLRSTGFGLVNAANSLGAVLAPLAIPFIALAFGWRGTFVVAGLAGLGWAFLWLIMIRRVRFGPDRTGTMAADMQRNLVYNYGPLLTNRRTWAVAIAKIFSDATWWLLLFWMPDFFNRHFGLSGVGLGVPLALAYSGAAVGSLIGGTLSTRLLDQGYSLNAVRKGVLLGSALLVVPVPLALYAQDYWLAVGVLAVTLAGHQSFSANLFALIADVAPHEKVGRVTSFGSFCGNLGGMAIVKIAGLILTAGLGYMPLFLFASVSYLLGIGWIHLLLPKIERAEP